MVMLIIIMVLGSSIRFGRSEAIDFNLNGGEHYVFLENDLKSKSWCINWQYNSTNYYLTTNFINLEVWVVTQASYESWDKVNTNSIVGHLISSGPNNSGKFRLPSKDVWYVVIYNKIGSLRAYVTCDVTFDFEPILGSNRNKLLIIFSAMVVISGISIPIFVRQRKKLKRIQALQESKNEEIIQKSVEKTLVQISSTTPVSLGKIIDYTKKMLESEMKNDSNLRRNLLKLITKNTCEKHIISILLQNGDLGKYYDVEQVFEKKIYDSKITQETTRKVVNCYYCGFPLDENDLSCTSCKKEITICVVCKLPVSFGDNIGQCSLCESKGHLTHLQEWVKVKGKCPHCLQEMPIESIMQVEIKEGKGEKPKLNGGEKTKEHQ